MATITNTKIAKIASLAHELTNEETPAIEMIAGLYPRGYLTLFAAQAGTGKTWLMEYIACRLSVGGNILAGLVPNSPAYKTVIFAGETGKLLLQQRLNATCWRHDSTKIHIYDAVELQREDIPIMLNTEEGRITTLAILENEKPDVIYYDTLISFHTADESKQGEMASIYGFLLKVASAFNCAVVLNHHTRKRNSKNPTAALTQDDIIGSNVGVRLASKAYIAERVTDAIDDDEGMPTVRVHDVKQWDKRLPDFTYKFITDPESNKLDFAIEWGTTEQTQKWSMRERLMTYINALPVGTLITAQDVATNLVTSTENARYHLDAMVSRGILERTNLLTTISWRRISS